MAPVTCIDEDELLLGDEQVYYCILLPIFNPRKGY